MTDKPKIASPLFSIKIENWDDQDDIQLVPQTMLEEGLLIGLVFGGELSTVFTVDQAHAFALALDRMADAVANARRMLHDPLAQRPSVNEPTASCVCDPANGRTCALHASSSTVDGTGTP